MRTPVVIVSGVDAAAMAAAVIGLQFDLPGAVCVHHVIDPERQVLTRIVSDADGVIERHEVELAHACVGCAIREDIVPTLERLARERRWSAILAHLPVGAEAAHLCTVLSRDPRIARVLRVSTVVAAVRADGLADDLLGSDLLAERGLHSGPDDRRGLAEVLASVVEYGDVVVLDEEAAPVDRGLVTTLARPGVETVIGAHSLDSLSLLGHRHVHGRTESWTDPLQWDDTLGHHVRVADGVWRLELRSGRPFHPERLLESVEVLGGGRQRTRGCFWLPTRPEIVVGWDGAGGQLSIGEHARWGGRHPFTRIVAVGVGPAAPARLLSGFEQLLMGPGDVLEPGRYAFGDGLEPWLGPIREVA